MHRKWLNNTNKEKYLQVIHPQMRIQDWKELLGEHANIAPPPSVRDPNHCKKPSVERAGRKPTAASFVATRKQKDKATKQKRSSYDDDDLQSASSYNSVALVFCTSMYTCENALIELRKGAVELEERLDKS
jgi:hypothetical protein